MSHAHARPRVSGRRLAWTILLNIGITMAEFLAGLYSGYLALLADAVHNLSDVAALLLAWLGVKSAQLPATKKSTYGYKRVEVMTAFVSAVALVVIALYILWEAYERLHTPKPIVHPWLFLSVAAVGLVGNLVSARLLLPEKGKSLNLRTAFLHMAFDALSSVVVIVGGVVIILTGWGLVDVILSTAIAIMIFWSSYLVIKEAVLVFLEAVPPGIDFDKVHATIRSIRRVQDVHDLHIWSLSSQETALSCHVCLEEKDFQAGPDIIGEIGLLLRKHFRIGHSTIQIEKKSCARPNLFCSYDDQQLE